MELRVLIAPDKFKGTLSAQAAAEAIAAGWQQARPGDRLELLPITDGGDGFGDLVGALIGAREQKTETVDAAHRPLSVAWGWAPKTRTAVVESARVIGLALLPPKKYHPFELDSFGLGALLQTIARKKPARCLIGVGGSATNDAGFGLARALGWQFINPHEKKPLERWTELWSLEQVTAPKEHMALGEVCVAVDVQNPLLGASGATRIYGPQKGLTPAETPLAERCLAKLARVLKMEGYGDAAGEPGAGAAGGLGFGLRCFTGGGLMPGFRIFTEYAELPARLREADLVITGEGTLDRSTLMGKGVGELGRLCETLRRPCLAFVGQARVGGRATACFRQVYPLSRGDPGTLERATQHAADALRQKAAEAAARWE